MYTRVLCEWPSPCADADVRCARMLCVGSPCPTLTGAPWPLLPQASLPVRRQRPVLVAQLPFSCRTVAVQLPYSCRTVAVLGGWDFRVKIINSNSWNLLKNAKILPTQYGNCTATVRQLYGN